MFVTVRFDTGTTINLKNKKTKMTEELKEISEQQKESWNRFSPGWKKWDNMTMDFLKPAGDEIMNLLNVKDNEIVLDVATGTGEPGLTIALKQKKGKVIATDLSEGMLEVARENALRRGIVNFETVNSDISALPFDDNTFDAVSCRFGFMFFPDMLLAAKEMFRVLKPGGRMATSVWNVPEKNFWITAITGTINDLMKLPSPPAGAPGMFRCAKEGLMSALLMQAGFKNINKKEVSGKLPCGTAETYWDFMTEIAAPVVAALSKADENMKQLVKAEVLRKVNEKYPGDNVAIDSSAIVIYGEK
ncbi:MAG: Ubiquinone/menaquinone biosynthesis C-methyltransferase UbiE [Ignavibacteria bacterium]|nr:Ubiquinone/menaquinone biosynthesis C-methyltransferase UbiE [Ignavibacteria bacterium]